MKKTFSEKTTQEKALYIFLWALRLVILLFFAYSIYLRITTGQQFSYPLIIALIMVFVGSFNIRSAHNRHQGSEAEQKKFNNIVLRSIVIAVVIMVCVIVGTVLYAINR